MIFGNVGLSPGVKRPGHETDSSYPSNAEVKNDWISALSASINAFMACIGKTLFFIVPYFLRHWCVAYTAMVGLQNSDYEKRVRRHIFRFTVR